MTAVDGTSREGVPWSFCDSCNQSELTVLGSLASPRDLCLSSGTTADRCFRPARSSASKGTHLCPGSGHQMRYVHIRARVCECPVPHLPWEPRAVRESWPHLCCLRFHREKITTKNVHYRWTALNDLILFLFFAFFVFFSPKRKPACPISDPDSLLARTGSPLLITL